MVAFCLYLITGVAMLEPPRRVPIPLLAAAATLGARLALFGAPGADGFAQSMATWMETTALMVAVAALLLAGAKLLRAMRFSQESALEAQRRASEIKNEFVSMITHELRTPLTTISGFAATLQEAWQHLDQAEIDEFLSLICAETSLLSNLVDDVLSIPRLEAGRLRLEPVDFPLRPAAFRIADLIFPEGGDTETSVSVPGTVVVHADPNRVEQVLRNLLDNARKYGGNRVGIEAVRQGAHYMVVVTDNGAGVPEEYREGIFDRFEQGANSADAPLGSGSGIGLGLTVTRHLVEAMGGEVWYEPGFPIGARFCFTLPAGTAGPSEQPAQGKAEAVSIVADGSA
jgi:signal transduction histidine kinase